MTDRLQKMVRGEPQRIVVATPPRHGKTESLLHFMPWVLRQRPEWTIGYHSYGAGITASKSKAAQMLARRAGVDFGGSSSEWRTPDRGGVLATSVNAGLTGQGLNIGIIDDPVKDRLQAESAVYRERLWDWFRDVFYTRLEPGSSVVINMARWHPDDLAGRVIKEFGWEYICLPAISTDETGKQTTLWPEQWPLAAMLDKKNVLGAYSFEALYQGQPRPRGGTVFGDPAGWGERPKQYRVAIGLDLAYTEKTSSDYSCAVVMLEWQGLCYVIDCIHVQTRAPAFLEMLLLLKKRYPTAAWRAYASGTEAGAFDFMRPKLPGLLILPPKGDKFVRAIPYAAAWNAHRVLVPEDEDSPTPPWLNDFLAEHAVFTGVKDEHDDFIDAAVAAYDSLVGGNISYEGLREGAKGNRAGMRRT